MDTWVWHQVGLELSDIDVQSTIETKGSGQGGDDLSNQSIQVGVSWSLDGQISSTDIVNSLIVDHKCTIGMFQGCMRGEDGIVWFDNGSRNLRCWVNSKFKF